MRSGTHRSLWPGWLESWCLWIWSCSSRSLSGEAVGSRFSVEASLGGSGAGLLVTAVMPSCASADHLGVLAGVAGAPHLREPGPPTPKSPAGCNCPSLTHTHIPHTSTRSPFTPSLSSSLPSCRPHLAHSHVIFCFSASSPTESLLGTISRLRPTL